MRSSLLGGAICVLFAFGCGGNSQRDGSHDNPDARGGAGAIATGGSAGVLDADIGGSAGALLVARGGAAGAAGSLCTGDQLGCDTGAAYVDVSDTETVRLAYFADIDQAASDGTCHIVATGSSACGFVKLSFSACSAPNGAGVCLDMTSNERHYTDASGKRWTMLSLGGSSALLKDTEVEGVVDLDLTLTLGEDSTYREVAVHVHACARIVPTLVPC